MPNNAEYEAARIRYLHKLVRLRNPQGLVPASPGIVVETKPRETDGKINVKILHRTSVRPLWWVVDTQERPGEWRLEVYRG